jgi:hypothetical protein
MIENLFRKLDAFTRVSAPWLFTGLCEPVCPENLKLLRNLTFSEFLLMLDRRTSPSPDMAL